MAVPLVVLLPMIGRALITMLSRWQGLLALIGVVVATSFSLKMLLSQATSSALSLWPILTMACLFLLAREFIRGWLAVKSKETLLKENK